MTDSHIALVGGGLWDDDNDIEVVDDEIFVYDIELEITSQVTDDNVRDCNVKISEKRIARNRGSADQSEIFIAPLGLVGDVDLDGGIDADDIDTLWANVAMFFNPFITQPRPAVMDLDDNGVVENDDVRILVQDILGTDFGDADLNQTIDLIDFGYLAGGFGEDGGWVDGNFDGFLGINILDFGLLADNYGKGLTGAQSPVPEPAGLVVLLVGLILGVRRPRLSQ